MSPNLTPDQRRPGDLLPFLLLSLLTHAALLAWLSFEPVEIGGESEPPPIVVQLDPVPPSAPAAEAAAEAPTGPAPDQRMAARAPENQIVAPSDRENELAPEGPAFLSDRDNRVETQTIRRGNPEAGTPGAKPVESAVPEAPAEAPPPEPEPAPEPEPEVPAEPVRAPAREAIPTSPARPLPGLDRLFAPPAEVLARAKVREPDPAATRPRPQNDPRRDLMTSPPPAPGIMGGLRGSFDHLPDVAAGQLTMLNTKADRFAPFVRRVGTRVFQNLLIYQRRDLDGPDILAATQLVTVRAILDESGTLSSVEVLDRSGSPAMDRTLVEALKQAAFDPNPPVAAANTDGKFEFIFQAQILANVQPGVRQQRIRAVESRLRIGLM